MIKSNNLIMWRIIFVKTTTPWVKRTIKGRFWMFLFFHWRAVIFINHGKSCLIITIKYLGPQIGIAVHTYFCNFWPRCSDCHWMQSSALTEIFWFSSFLTIWLLIHILFELKNVWWHWMVGGFVIVNFCLGQVKFISGIITITLVICKHHIASLVNCCGRTTDVISSAKSHLSLNKFRRLLIRHIRISIFSFSEGTLLFLRKMSGVDADNIFRLVLLIFISNIYLFVLHLFYRII